ncbi:MAG: hypothetical protein AB7G13_14230 [Lautropia sp.]
MDDRTQRRPEDPSEQAGRPLRAAEVDPGMAALCVAAWPILVIHLCYGWSVAEGFVELCNPYWDGCSSISRAGRHGSAHHLFKAAMLPYAALLGVFWWVCHHWLATLAARAGLPGPSPSGSRGSPALLAAGWLGVVFLVLYATFLGIDGPAYQLMRRYGINVYFGATWLAQTILAVRLLRLSRVPAVSAGPGPVLPRAIVVAITVLSAGVFVLGAAFFAARGLVPLDRDRWENALEWIIALAMQASLLLVAAGWRASRLRIAFG